MKTILLLIPTLLLIFSCCPEQKDLTAEQLKLEKEAVINVIKAYNKAADAKNFSAMVETLAGEVTFFGTDSAEVITTFSDYKKQMLKQWDYYDEMKYGELYDVHIQMDKQVTFASAIFGVPITLRRGNQIENHFLRVARTFKKEKGKWVISSGIVGITRSGDQISDNLQ